MTYSDVRRFCAVCGGVTRAVPSPNGRSGSGFFWERDVPPELALCDGHSQLPMRWLAPLVELNKLRRAADEGLAAMARWRGAADKLRTEIESVELPDDDGVI